MRFAIVAIGIFLGVVVADVSHLSNMYLPPVLSDLTHTQQYTYVQENHDIAQAAVQEVVDNSVVENVAAKEEAAIDNGQLIVERERFDGDMLGQIHTAGVVAQHVQKAIDVAHQVQAHAQQAAAYDVSTESHSAAAPGSEVYQSTLQQQTTYHTQVNQQQEQEQNQQVQEPQQYYTGNIIQQQERIKIDVPAPQPAQEQQYQSVEPHVEHNVAISAPVVPTYSRQQTTDYYGQKSASLGSSGSDGIETQYAANGGYVY